MTELQGLGVGRTHSLDYKDGCIIHGNLVANGWVGADMQKPLAFQKFHGRTERQTDRHGKVKGHVTAI